MPRPAITVENLSKAYRIGLKEEIPDTLVGALASFARSPYDNFRNLRRLNTFRNNGHAEDDIVWALKDVSFEVQKGEVVGIIGRNGAGKSTLLKILSRITEPTSGRARIRGRVSSLLEVGTGFHSELSGRENIYMNGTILGMKKREIDRKFDEIVEFSGVEKFLDTPIKRYSSGMKVRLAFSVAAHLEPEILVIDEVLAVGDAEFQKKCLGKMDEVAQSGRTVLFVSHNMGAVQNLCSRGILIDLGRAVLDGSIDNAVQHYFDSQATRRNGGLEGWTDRRGNGRARITSVQLFSTSGSPIDYVSMAHTFDVRIEFICHQRLRAPVFNVAVTSGMGQRLLTFRSKLTGKALADASCGGVLTCRVAHLPLVPGDYSLRVSIGEAGAGVADDVDRVARLSVVPSANATTYACSAADGVCFAPVEWLPDFT